uniref:Beta-2-glycoprotein 1 n=1 Tax=Periophthalmus magnuspinnatus TaxID=409849 RepID=A0A3B3ZDW5_9GOBI
MKYFAILQHWGPFNVDCVMFVEVCPRPELGDNIKAEGLQRFYNPGEQLVLSCVLGYKPSYGLRYIVCMNTGIWSANRFRCEPVQCPHPDPPVNGQLHYEDTLYENTVNYTCNDGFNLVGARSASCLIDGRWSAEQPLCEPVSCDPAPIPKFGLIVYDKIIKRHQNIQFGTTGTYKCLPPFALFGKEKAECTASGQWTETPQCREVSCPPPENIEHGYMSISQKRDFDYTEMIKYGCDGDYVLDGPQDIVCEKTGEWSEKPSCKAPCSVEIRRGRIMYKENKIWIENFEPKQILHGEILSVYCLDEDKKCGYATPAQCDDGNLQLPTCFQEPNVLTYLVKSSLPSEIQQC